MAAYLVAVKPDFSGPKWATSMQNLLTDGCGVLVPIGPTNSSPNACRLGATPGVDPTTNALGSAEILDQASSSPTVLPDGSVVFGAMTNYNGFRGHMFKFSSAGTFTGAYDFGWDSTPAVYSHGGSYSIVLKDNHYGGALYCSGNNTICQSTTPGPYYITQLDPNLNIEWQFQSTNTQSCTRSSNGGLTCTSTNPNGFEWCINMPAVDVNGNVYATSEDGNLYVLPQGNSGIFTTPTQNLFLNLAVGAAYTPIYRSGRTVSSTPRTTATCSWSGTKPAACPKRKRPAVARRPCNTASDEVLRLEAEHHAGRNAGVVLRL